MTEAAPRPLPPVRGVTMADVARVAGVSRGTVSRYVRKTGYVSSGAAKSIEAAIHETGYVPNVAARSLAGMRARNIALVIHQDATLFAEDPNLMGMMVGANQFLTTHDHQLLVMIHPEQGGLTRFKNALYGGFLDGIMLAAPRIGDPLVGLIQESGLPASLVGARAEGLTIPVVDVDNYTGAYEMVTYLLDRAPRTAKRVAMIAGPRDTTAAQDRRQAFVDCLEARAIEPIVEVTEHWSYDSGLVAARALLDAHPDVDTVFCANDSLAAAVMTVLQDRGRTVPDDVRVAGFDDSRWAMSTTPHLTTVAQPAEAMGVALAELVVRQLGGESLGGQLFLQSTQIVVRGSA